MSSRSFNPLPACPIPIQWDVPGRIAELQAMIDDPATSELQKINLQTAINLYHEKELPGRLKWIQDGKVVHHKNVDFWRPYWVEGYGQQLSSQAMIPAIIPEPSSAPLPQPVSESVAFESVTRTSHDVQLLSTRPSPWTRAWTSQIFARVRPVPGLLSPAFSIDITMLNDTGSNTLTVFDTDLVALAIPSTYRGFGANIPITTVGGTVMRQQITVEIQLLDFQGNAVSDWVLEEGIVTPAATGAIRLSGDGIRQSMYFVTAPGNQHLYVAEKKKSIIEQLPVI